MNAECVQQRQHRAAEEMIQEFSKYQLLHANKTRCEALRFKLLTLKT
jgi:hypothetical protein